MKLDKMITVHTAEFVMKHSIGARWRRLTFKISHKIQQTRRLSRKTVALGFLLAGATLVAVVSMVFAHLADYALTLNAQLVARYPWFAWLAMPLGFMLIVWFTRRYAPYTVGSGIPQVLASLSLPYGPNKGRLISLPQTLLKIPLTFFGMLVGASIGREGPSVQVGAAVTSAWGKWCKKHDLAFRGLQENDLIAAGAAGGLAAAFNAPLAGVVFAIEELGRGVLLRWERQIFIGILAAGFVLVALEGNNPHFRGFTGVPLPDMTLWVLGCALVCGVAGGLFARFLFKGIGWLLPENGKKWAAKHPILLAGLLGLLLAALGTLYQGQLYGTGYLQASSALLGATDFQPGVALAKWVATVLSYWAGLPGGIFTPSLTIGAMIGQQIAAWGGSVDYSGVIVLVCMTAFLAAATQSPLTASVVVMEMTGSQNLLFWMLVGSIVASQVSRQFSPKPFYHAVGARFRQRIQEETRSDRPVAAEPNPSTKEQA